MPKRLLYRLLFSNGLAYRSPRWYAVADWLKGETTVTA